MTTKIAARHAALHSPEPHQPRSTATFAASVGSVLSAFLASACCMGPLVFALLGLGGAGLLVRFEPYRPYFLAITFGLLGAGFYFTYSKRKPSTSASPGPSGATSDCPAPRTSRAGRIVLWLATVLVIGFVAFPHLAPVLFG
jgi:mercuric ion transport protein